MPVSNFDLVEIYKKKAEQSFANQWPEKPWWKKCEGVIRDILGWKDPKTCGGKVTLTVQKMQYLPRGLMSSYQGYERSFCSQERGGPWCACLFEDYQTAFLAQAALKRDWEHTSTYITAGGL